MDLNINGVPNKCDICCANSRQLIYLLKQEKVLLEKIFALLNIQVPIKNLPSVCCNFCLQKFHSCKLMLKDILIHHSNYLPYVMQGDHDPQNEVKTEPHEPDFRCSCANCQSKYGDLPLLVEVIEKEETKSERLAEASSSSGPSTSSNWRRKSMECEHCGKEFSHKGDLNKHLRTHTKEQPFSCPECHRKFAHTSNLSRHLRIHSGEKPFVCPSCSKSFSRRDKLYIHQNSRQCRKHQ